MDVGTIVPTAETLSNIQFHHKEYLHKHAKRYEIKVTPVSSDQTYKDTMRTLDQFFDDHDVNDQSLRHRLVPLMTTGQTVKQPSKFLCGLLEHQARPPSYKYSKKVNRFCVPGKAFQ